MKNNTNRFPIIEQTTSYIFEAGNTHFLRNYYYNNDNEYFITDNSMTYSLIMHLGYNNIKIPIRHITHTIKFGKNFSFIVLGELVFEGENIYSIKPFAIWRY